MLAKTNIKKFILILICIYFGSISTPVSKLLMFEFNYIQILFIRFLTASIIVIFISLISKQKIETSNKIIVCSLIATLSVICFMVGLSFLKPSTAQLLYSLTPIFIYLVKFSVERKFNKHYGLLILILTIIIISGILFGESNIILFTNFYRIIIGVILIILSVTLFSIYTLIIENSFKNVSKFSLLFNFIFVTFLVISLIGNLSNSYISLIGNENILKLFIYSSFVGGFGTVGFYYLYNYINNKYSSKTSSVVYLFIPALVMLLNKLIFNEKIGYWSYISLILIMIVLIIIRKIKVKLFPEIS